MSTFGLSRLEEILPWYDEGGDDSLPYLCSTAPTRNHSDSSNDREKNMRRIVRMSEEPSVQYWNDRGNPPFLYCEYGAKSGQYPHGWDMVDTAPRIGSPGSTLELPEDKLLRVGTCTSLEVPSHLGKDDDVFIKDCYPKDEVDESPLGYYCIIENTSNTIYDSDSTAESMRQNSPTLPQGKMSSPQDESLNSSQENFHNCLSAATINISFKTVSMELPHNLIKMQGASPVTEHDNTVGGCAIGGLSQNVHDCPECFNSSLKHNEVDASPRNKYKSPKVLWKRIVSKISSLHSHKKRSSRAFKCKTHKEFPEENSRGRVKYLVPPYKVILE